MTYYQVLEQSKPNEPWHFIAHGARYEKAHAQEAVEAAARLGVKRRMIYCGKVRT
jgi:hypothetical protein